LFCQEAHKISTRKSSTQCNPTPQQKQNPNFTMSHQLARASRTLRQSAGGIRVTETTTTEITVRAVPKSNEVFYPIGREGVSHLMLPGDWLECACGHLELCNVTHMRTCEINKTYYFVMQGTVLAHAYCKKRHKQQPTVWGDPGNCRMIHHRYATALTERIGHLVEDNKNWNALMPLKTLDKDGRKIHHSYLWDHIQQIWSNSFEEGDEANELYLTDSTETTIQSTFKIPPYVPTSWSKADQLTMERGRAQILHTHSVTRMDHKHPNPLPFEHAANYLGTAVDKDYEIDRVCKTPCIANMVYLRKK
jgi:hypothetical protein